MIQANELRIGNWVLGASRGEFLTVSGNLIEQIERGIVVVGPIQLTEEWLVRFGLKLKPNHTAFHIKGMQFEIPSMIGGYYDNEYGLDKETVIELKHVHQLQNLYFALTGEELKLNDK